MIHLKLGYSPFAGLLTMAMFVSAAACCGQNAPQTELPPPAQSAQPPASDSQQQSKPGDPQSPSNAQGQSSPLPNAPNKAGDSQKASDPKQADETKKDDTKKKDDRMFYVMPNYLTVDGASQTPPISWKEKFAISAKGTFDPYEFVIVGVVAGIRQGENSYPAFGQGASGYFKRYGAAFADQVDGNIMVGGVYPSLLKTDPRYFRLGKGTILHRFGYAATRIVITRRDSGSAMFNIPEFAGNATAIAISNVYYPSSDRSAASSAYGWTVQMGIDAFGNELKEFWPDIHGYLQRRHQRHLEKKAGEKADE